MPIQRVRVVQFIRIERSIIVEIEADTLAEAIELSQQQDAPGEDAAWVEDGADLVEELHQSETEDQSDAV